MYQQINLYQPVFRRQRKALSAATLLQVLLIAAAMLLGVFLHTQWTVNSLRSTADALASQYRHLETQLGNLENPHQSAADAVLDEVRRLQATIDARQALLERLARLTINDSHAFGDFFETLATLTTPGLWLTGIRLDMDGTTEIRGSAMDPALVPRYLQDMPAQTRFHTLLRGSVHITRDDPDNPAVDFVLSSTDREAL